MKNFIRVCIVVLSIFSMSCSSVSKGNFSQTTISNGIVEATVSTETWRLDNYYQAQRFDWSGFIFSLKCNGHSYFGEWVEAHDPTFHDNACGPVDEFTQIGYENAKVGENFLKIGVGVLKKKVDVPYTFRVGYEVVDHGKWECTFDKNSITYTQTLRSDIASYIYKKTIELVDGKPEMKIKHTLKNIGVETISTNVYCHNFFIIDNEPAGKPIRLKCAYNPTGAERRFDTNQYSELVGNTISFKDTLPAEKSVLYCFFDGHNKVENNDFTFENTRTGACARIRGDRPLEKFAFWSCPKTYCVEPFVKIFAKPNDEFSWTLTYEFFENKSDKK